MGSTRTSILEILRNANSSGRAHYRKTSQIGTPCSWSRGISRARCADPSIRGPGADMSPLFLKRASASRLSGEWGDDDCNVLAEGIVVGRIMKAAAAAPLPAWRRDEREPRTDISQVELQLHGLRDAPRRGLHQLRREDRGADPGVRPQRARRRAVLGRLPRGDRAVLLYAARALACAASVVAVGATVTAAMPRAALWRGRWRDNRRWAWRELAVLRTWR